MEYSFILNLRLHRRTIQRFLNVLDFMKMNIDMARGHCDEEVL